MAVRRLLKFLFGVLLAAFACHVIWSTALAAASAAYYTHRVFDVRKLDPSEDLAGDLIQRFIRERLLSKVSRHVVTVGSSLTYGYPWQVPVIFTARMAELRPDLSVINIGVLGADISKITSLQLCAIRPFASTVEVLFVEIPVINEVNFIAKTLRRENDIPRVGSIDGCTKTLSRSSYFGFYLSYPYGVGWIPFIWDSEAYPKPDREIQIAAVPSWYFASAREFAGLEHHYADRVKRFLVNAKSAGKRVYAYPSPIYLPAVSEVGADASSVRAQLNRTLALCREVEGIRCMDPSKFYDRRELYYNLTHFNQRGHRAMAAWLVESLAEHVDARNDARRIAR